MKVGIEDMKVIIVHKIKTSKQVSKRVSNTFREADPPMKPAGYVLSVRTLPSTLTSLWFTIFFTSSYVRAYLRRLRRNTASGRHSRSLCGPQLGRGAYNCTLHYSNRNGKTRYRSIHTFLTYSYKLCALLGAT